MRKAERLFQLVNTLRSKRRVVTGKQLAGALGVSERTIYRDIQALSLSGIPIEGEAGVGYRLVPGFNLPPIMFDMDELEAIRFGVRMVQAWSDEALAQSAATALDKIHAILPDNKHHDHHRHIEHLIAPDYHNTKATQHSHEIRAAAKQHRKLSISYQDESQQRTNRTVWPLGLIYWGAAWTLVAWCELRHNYRLFRLDRIQSLATKEARFETRPDLSLEHYLSLHC